jgi:hypothetical protein
VRLDLIAPPAPPPTPPTPPPPPILPPMVQTNNRRLQAVSSFSMEDEIKTTAVQNIEYPSEDELEEAEELGSAAGVAAVFGSTGAEYVGFLATISGLDQSGLFVQFAQGTKLVTRHRMVGVNHGLLLRTFFRKSNENIDPISELSVKEILTLTNGNKQKFTKFRAPLSLLEFKMIPMIVYLFSWILKFISMAIIAKVSRKLKTSKFECYFIQI